MNARTLLGAAVAAVAVMFAGNGVAAADSWVDPADYMVGDTVYFAGSMGGCTIRPNGDVGCDLNGTGSFYGIPAPDLVIDVAFLPAHPTFGLFGRYARPGARSLPWDNEPPYDREITSLISYAGATCVNITGRYASIACDSKGHYFKYGVGGTQVR
ncbi:hypothetical protein AB0N05_03045 [Nocardia sp. NPDC051030]|uniref:hypothetical protein n=1 Tax=Nocardia sp. NPDC051030 TaxID=3155162 RepID=UPI00343E249E